MKQYLNFRKDENRGQWYLKYVEKGIKIILLVVVMLVSIYILKDKISESEYVQSAIVSLENSEETIAKFSGTTIATSVAISALPDDLASPLANTISDLNIYFIFMLIVVFVEKLIVLEGVKIALTYIIPFSCFLYIGYVLFKKDIIRMFANKVLILGVALVVVIPFSTHFTETVCEDYLDYVDQTIEETENGTDKINEIISEKDKDTSFLDKLSGVVDYVVDAVSDLVTYFQNVIRKFVNSVAILIVLNFVLPLLNLLLFRWLLNELFALNLPKPKAHIRLPKGKIKGREDDETFLLEKEDAIS